jgi:hypothetical protein
MLGLGESLLEVLFEKLGEGLGEWLCQVAVFMRGFVGCCARYCLRLWIYTSFKNTPGKLPVGCKRASICGSF